MSDLISRSVLLEDMKKELEKAVNSEDISEDECKVLLTSALALKSFVNRQPTVEALPKEKLQEIVERLEEKLVFYKEKQKEAYEDKDWDDFDRYIDINRGIYEAFAIVEEVGGMNESRI